MLCKVTHCAGRISANNMYALHYGWDLCQMFHYSAYNISQTCFNRGVETVVVPKTSATAESGWMGLAKYAWSGYVNSLPTCTLYS